MVEYFGDYLELIIDQDQLIIPDYELEWYNVNTKKHNINICFLEDPDDRQINIKLFINIDNIKFPICITYGNSHTNFIESEEINNIKFKYRFYREYY